jgi:hypothetical protein
MIQSAALSPAHTEDRPCPSTTPPVSASAAEARGGVWRPDAGAGQAAPRRGGPACAEGRPGALAVFGSVSVCRVRAAPSSPQGVYEVCHAFAASLPRLLAVGATAKACRPRGDSCFRGVGKGYRLRTGPRKHGTPAWSPGVCGRMAKLCGNGPNRPCQTAPDDADEGKADRPPSRAVSVLRSWQGVPLGYRRAIVFDDFITRDHKGERKRFRLLKEFRR